VVIWRFLYAHTLLRFRRQKYFTFRNETYQYFYHPYNSTWDNERCIEIPIVKKVLESFSGKRILEVGNVLSHYFPVTWDVLDKFEDKNDIICCDVVDFKPSQKYDLILCVSTLEHIGFDDDIQEPHKIIEALDNLQQNCLKPTGRMFFTMPLGYNTYMDDLLFHYKLGFDKRNYFKRLSRYEWSEVKRDELGDVTYASRYIEAGAIVIAELTGGG